MSASLLSLDSRGRLASLLDESRRHLVATIVGPFVRPRASSLVANASATSFLDRLSEEIASSDRRALDAWAVAAAASEGAFEQARIVAVACATIASAYEACYGAATDVAAYLATRSNEVDSLLRPIVPVSGHATGSERDEAVASLLSALDARDASTCEHARAVGIWCGRVAKQLGMSLEEQIVATLAGTLHDVGKIATPTEVLLKAGALDDVEWTTMRAHARVGAKMLERVPSLREVAPFVRAHHERIDGTGYPDRLAGASIPMIARVVSVADSFHAMISKRPYRAAIPVARALEELRRGTDTQFDVAATDAMFAIVAPAGAPRLVRKVVNGTS